MRRNTSVAGRLVRTGKRLALIFGLVAALALPVSASASSSTAAASTFDTSVPADGIGDSPLMP